MERTAALPDLLEEAESMRRQRRLHEALEVVERFLRRNPDHPRALLLRSRVLYELDRMAQAVDALHTLQRIIGDEMPRSILAAMERLADAIQPTTAPSFVTVSMASLFTQQGYLLEALEVYRRLLETAPDQEDWHAEIARLKTKVQQEGSRGATRERVARELEACEPWLKQRQRGS